MWVGVLSYPSSNLIKYWCFLSSDFSGSDFNEVGDSRLLFGTILAGYLSLYKYLTIVVLRNF